MCNNTTTSGIQPQQLVVTKETQKEYLPTPLTAQHARFLDFNSGIGGLLTSTETVLDDSGQGACHYISKRITQFATRSQEDTEVVCVLGGNKGMSRVAAEAAFKREVAKCRAALAAGRSLCVISDGDPCAEAGAGSDEESKHEKAERRAGETRRGAQLKKKGQPYWRFECGELKSNAGETAGNTTGYDTVGIAWFIVMLLSDEAIRIAEQAGRVMVIQLPGRDYLFNNTGKAAACARPPAHIVAPQPEAPTWESYEHDQYACTLQGAAKQRYGALNQALSSDTDSKMNARAVYFGGGAAARSDLAILLGFDFRHKRSEWIVTGSLTSFSMSAVEVYNIPVISKRTGGLPVATSLQDSRANQLTIGLMGAILAQEAEHWEMSIPEPEGEVVEAMQKWTMDTHVVRAGDLSMQAWTATRKHLSEPSAHLTQCCEAPACRAMNLQAPEEASEKAAPLVLEYASEKAVLPACKLEQFVGTVQFVMVRFMMVTVGVACMLAGLASRKKLRTGCRGDQHSLLENSALPIVSVR